MPENAISDHPNAPMDAERLRDYLRGALTLHHDVADVRNASTLAMDRLALIVEDSSGLRWRVWFSIDPWSDAR